MAAPRFRTYRVIIPVANLGAPLFFRTGNRTVGLEYWHPYKNLRSLVHAPSATAFIFDTDTEHCDECLHMATRRINRQTQGLLEGDPADLSTAKQWYRTWNQIEVTLLHEEPAPD